MSGATDQARKSFLWQKLDAARGEISLQFIPMCEWLLTRDVQLSPRDLVYLHGATDGKKGSWGVSELVVDTVTALVSSQRQARRVLDPYAGTGLLGACIAESFPEVQVDVVVSQSTYQTLLESLNLPNLRILGAEKQTDREKMNYDLLLSCPPPNTPSKEQTFELAKGVRTLKDDPALLHLVDQASHLPDHGLAYFVVSPRFADEQKPTSVRQNLNDFGLHITSLLSFRPGTFPGTAIPLDLAVLSRRPTKQLYVGEIPVAPEEREAFLGRYRKRKQGPSANLGRLVDPETFHGLPALVAREQYDKMGKKVGWAAVPVEDVVKTIQRPKLFMKPAEAGGDAPDVAYLPETLGKQASINQSAMSEKKSASHLRLELNTEIVLPAYFAGWLNSPLGHVFRQSISRGAIANRIPVDLLMGAKLYLPDKDSQQQALDIYRNLGRLRSELNEIESDLWQSSGPMRDILEALQQVNREDRFSDWLESLPFPLASILRTYHAVDQHPKDKYERLLHFFEAFTELTAVIHMSAFKNNSPERWEIHRKSMVKSGVSLSKHTSFGLWLRIVECMGSALRRMMANDSEMVEARHIYATSDEKPLFMLSSKELISMLGRTKDMRNQWKGHGGAVSPDEAERRLQKLEDELAVFRGLVGHGFGQYQLLEARECEVLDELFRTRVRRVMGSNPQLEHDVVELTEPARTGQLYFHNPGYHRALKLVPFIEVRDSPQPAGYFYNRMAEGDLHLVSYQFAEQSQVSSGNKHLIAFIRHFDSGDGVNAVLDDAEGTHADD